MGRVAAAVLLAIVVSPGLLVSTRVRNYVKNLDITKEKVLFAQLNPAPGFRKRGPVTPTRDYQELRKFYLEGEGEVKLERLQAATWEELENHPDWFLKLFPSADNMSNDELEAFRGNPEFNRKLLASFNHIVDLFGGQRNGRALVLKDSNSFNSIMCNPANFRKAGHIMRSLSLFGHKGEAVFFWDFLAANTKDNPEYRRVGQDGKSVGQRWGEACDLRAAVR